MSRKEEINKRLEEIDKEIRKSINWMTAHQIPYNRPDGSSPRIMKRWEENNINPPGVKHYKIWSRLNAEEDELKKELENIKVKPTSAKDLAAITSLFRPGQLNIHLTQKEEEEK